MRWYKSGPEQPEEERESKEQRVRQKAKVARKIVVVWALDWTIISET
jgi:hypothetical protein